MSTPEALENPGFKASPVASTGPVAPRMMSWDAAVHPNPSPNFAFLGHHNPRLVALGTQAEQQFAIDPNVTLYKLRQFCEVLAKRAAAKVGLLLDYERSMP